MRGTKDIETILYNLLTDGKYSASAHAIPASLGSTLPHIHVISDECRQPCARAVCRVVLAAELCKRLVQRG